MTYLTAAHICDRYKISATSLWRYERDPSLGFPKPFVVKRRKLYDEAAVEEWERKRSGKESA